MTQAQASKVLKAASGQAAGFVKVVRASKGRYGATHAATFTSEPACGNKPHPDATVTGVETPWAAMTAVLAPIAGRLADRYPAGILGGIGGSPFGGPPQGPGREGVVRGAHFPPFKQVSFRITYPFSIRPAL